MIFNIHSDLKGQHSFLSPSQHAWINYDEEKLEQFFNNRQAAKRGTELHEFAMNAIRLRIRLARSQQTLNMYINDAIGFRMIPEQVLFYSYNAFGTADAISFRKDFLRIHDLKTGASPTSMSQLLIYMAYFCLEYRIKPFDIQAELRIYQNDYIQVMTPDPDEVTHIMDRVVHFDKRIEEMKAEAI